MNKQQRTQRARINVNRLFRLADLLRELPPKEFNMELWISKFKGMDNVFLSKGMANKFNVKKPQPGCGTVCCIAGWATAIHPDLVIKEAQVKNTRTGKKGEIGFGQAFGITLDESTKLTKWDAPHKSHIQAAAAVERLAYTLAERNDLEVVEV